MTLLSPFPHDIISKRVEISTPRSIHNGYRALRPRGGVQNEKIRNHVHRERIFG